MTMKAIISFGAAACLAASFAAPAAELPSKNAKPAALAEKMEKCEIGGEPGFRVGHGDTCLRVSGYVSAQVAAGNLKSH